MPWQEAACLSTAMPWQDSSSWQDICYLHFLFEKKTKSSVSLKCFPHNDRPSQPIWLWEVNRLYFCFGVKSVKMNKHSLAQQGGRGQAIYLMTSNPSISLPWKFLLGWPTTMIVVACCCCYSCGRWWRMMIFRCCWRWYCNVPLLWRATCEVSMLPGLLEISEDSDVCVWLSNSYPYAFELVPQRL